MWAAAIIIFREILEISFVVGMMMAATKSIPNNKRLVASGIGLGVVCAMIFAFLLSSASDSGIFNPEIFTASILTIAVLMVVYTIFWMKQHFADYKTKITKIVSDNTLPTISLVLIIASAMTREGAEIFIFLYGLAHTAALDYFSIFLGFLIGISGGVVVGLMFYYSMLKISPKYFFQITSVILTLFAASMSTEVANLLIEANVLPEYSNPLWDSSWLMSDDNILGQVFGYNPTPLPLQTIFYIGTLGSIMVLLVIGKFERE